MDKNKTVKIYKSFEAENQAEYKRRKQMTVEERCREFAAIQERHWGKKWTSEPIKKIATWEKTDW